MAEQTLNPDPALPVNIAAGMHGNLDVKQLECPVCHENYVHLDGKKVTVDPGNDSYESLGRIVRGDVLSVPFFCENDHKFEVCFGEHKGFIFIWARRIHDA